MFVIPAVSKREFRQLKELAARLKTPAYNLRGQASGMTAKFYEALQMTALAIF
jgi:hypothetical protein